ncbi:MAG TPA: CBS domain-containing protein, partial [Pseudolabrys sp.]|nr:CBS domain-containing protein [Pseudolabrys sp.]
MLDQDQEQQTIEADAAQLPRNKDGSIRKVFVKNVARKIDAADAAGLRDVVGKFHESDMGALIEVLPPEQRPRLVELLGIDFDFTALTEVADAVREEILEELPPHAVAKGVSEIESDDAVAILEDLPKDEQAEILEQLPQPERTALARSLDYPEESAGRRMQTEFIAVPPSWNVGQAIDYLRETQELPERFFEVYVSDENGRFRGAVPLDRLLRSKRPVPISDLMEPERRRIRADEDQEEVARLFQRYDLVAAPVVDADDRLVGIITFDDVADVIEEEAEEDIHALG